VTEPSWWRARELARETMPAGPVLTVTLASALGSWAAEDLVALGPVPHAATSAMDGWAVSGSGPWRLDTGSGDLAAGSARPIVTGAVPPDGAEAVLQSEHGRIRGGLLHGPTPPPGRHLRPAGEEADAGDVLVTAGSPLTPARLAVLAITGHDAVRVRRGPLARLLVTGDELRSTGRPEPGTVRDVMTPMLPPLLAALGARVARRERLRDDPLAVAAAAAAPGVDLIVSAGGTGRSAVDPTEDAWHELDARIVFRGVDMRPGHPASLAVLPDGRPWLALPGNPLAAAMTALSFVPALSAGYRCDDVPPLDSAEAAEPFTSRAGTTLVPAIRTEAGLVAASAARSHMLRGLAEADVVAVVPSEGVTAGGSVRVLPRVW